MSFKVSDSSRMMADVLNFGRPLNSEERKSATADSLQRACVAQIEILALAISTRQPFEPWIGRLLNLHFEQVLLGCVDTDKVDQKILLGRSADLYNRRNDNVTNRPKAGSPLNARTVALERFAAAYLAILPEQRRVNALSNICIAGGMGDGSGATKIEERLAQLVEAEIAKRNAWHKKHGTKVPVSAHDQFAPDEYIWSVRGLAKALFGLLSWRYISEISDFITPSVGLPRKNGH